MKKKTMNIIIEWSTIPGITNAIFLDNYELKRKKKHLLKIFPVLKNKSITKISICMD